ncbi:hypothetical protein [Cohnella yongneupensis]|uniref:Uncharacterized protein n=1 Tax=Cohnella yongneupensis TaxID=425006 RepID=A0ABW0R4T6_9BACL
MEKYQSEEFIEKFSEKVKDSVFDYGLDDIRTKINRILQKENLYFDGEGYLLLQSESKENETRICNFFVLPTHSLYYDDGEKIHEAGISVELYSRFNEDKYKRILVNLSDEAIEKGNWMSIEFIDRDFLIYKSDLYRYLRIAIKLSSRIIKEKAKKIFYNDEWLEDGEAVEHIAESRRERKVISIMKIVNGNEQENNQKEATDAVMFLRAQSQYISEIKMLVFPLEPSDEEGEWGWEDNDYYYLVYSKTWSWIRAYFTRKGFKLRITEKDLDHFLVESGIFESNEIRSKTNLKRADFRTSQLSNRVFKINKLRFNEFLLDMEK